MLYTRVVEDRKLMTTPIPSEYHAKWVVRSTSDVSIEPWRTPFRQFRTFSIKFQANEKETSFTVRARGKIMLHIRPSGHVFHEWTVGANFAHKKQRTLGVCLAESKSGSEMPVQIRKFDENPVTFQVVVWSQDPAFPITVAGPCVAGEVEGASSAVLGCAVPCPEVAEFGEDANALREGALVLSKQEDMRLERFQLLEQENLQLRARIDQLSQLLLANSVALPPESY
jgi:hypothetical protein